MDHYMFGRNIKIVDVLCAHPTVSKQHCVIQHRRVEKTDDFGVNQVC